MFARLLICVGLLALPYFGLVGCEEEGPPDRKGGYRAG